MPVAAPNGPMLIFDGDCSFCTSSAHWIDHRLPSRHTSSRGSASTSMRSGSPKPDVTTAAYWVDERGKRYRGHRSIGKALMAAGGIWKPIGALLLMPPFSWLAALGYVVIAKNRHRLPGGTPACKLN